MDSRPKYFENVDGYVTQGLSQTLLEVVSREQDGLHPTEQGVQDARRQEENDHMEEESQQQDRVGI